MKDKVIIQNLRSGQRNKALQYLYRELPKIEANICRSGGTKQEAEEIFTDALILLIEKVSDPKFELTSKLSTYLYGITRFLWMNELKKTKRKYELEWTDTLILIDEDLDYDSHKEEQLKQLETVISQVSQRCQEIFELFYFKKESMQTIADLLGFTSVNSAKTQKYKCIEKAVVLAESIQSKIYQS
ncbi:MAG: RNA polymerase sigma factor (sigma-70 family) [Glaciecola sp.]|jgi:RNA polymerase sigma factor (sigma-70 family)